MRIAAMESISLCERTKSCAFELESPILGAILVREADTLSVTEGQSANNRTTEALKRLES